MTMLECISRYQALWRVALPHVPKPTPQDAAHWCEYPPQIVERAIMRTGRRFAPDKLHPGFSALEAYRYTSAVSRAVTDEQR